MTNFFGGPIFDIDGLYLQLAAAGIVGIDYPGVVAPASCLSDSRR